MAVALLGAIGAAHAQVVVERFEDMALSPDGRLLAIASGAAVCHYAPEYRDQFAVHIVDRSSGQVVHELVGQACPVTSVSWHPDSTRLVTASIDGIRVWDVAQEIVTIHITNGATDQQAALRVFWSPDGRYIAYFGYQVTTLNLLDVETGEDVWAINVYGREPLTSAAWSHDSTKIATSAEESEIRVWSADTRELAQALDGHVGPVYSVAFSPDDTKLASGGADGTVRIWDIASGQSEVLTGHTDFVNTVEWSPDGTRIASGSSDQTVRLWDTASGELVDIISTGGPIYSVIWTSTDELIYGGFTADGTASLIEALPVATATTQPTETPSPSHTSTPTPTPSLTATPAAFQRLRLTSLCSANPAAYRLWRIRNSNPYDVVFTWDVCRSPTAQNGFGVAPPAVNGTASEVIISTVTEAGPNTLRLFVNGAQQDVKASGGATCPTPTPTP